MIITAKLINNAELIKAGWSLMSVSGIKYHYETEHGLIKAGWSLMSVSGIKYHYETEHGSPRPESVLFHTSSLPSFPLNYNKDTVSA